MPVKGSINRSYDPPSRPNPSDVETGSRGGDSMVVHVKKATEICFDDLVTVGVACFFSDELSTLTRTSAA